jgi:hypothetical protein
MSRDGGTFAYCGQRITEGALLYRDCWDHKPPGIFYLYAAFIAIGGPTTWSLWIGQSIWLTITNISFFSILRKIWGNSVALVSSLLMLLTLLHPTFYEGGNLTETSALLPITLTMGAYWGYLKTNKRVYLIGIGLFTAFSFLFKPTYISIGLAAGLIIAYRNLRQRNNRKALGELGIILMSCAIPLLLVAAYWAVRKDLFDLVYAVFTHNILYVEGGFSLRAFLGTLRIFIVEQPLAALSALVLLSLVTFIVGNWNCIRQNQPSKNVGMDQESIRFWFMLGLAVALFFDLIFTSISGKNYRHYFQIPILTMAAISAYLSNWMQQIKRTPVKKDPHVFMTFVAILVILLPYAVEVFGKEIPNRKNLDSFLSNPNVSDYRPDAIEQFIIDHSQPDQSILVWDYEPAIYFHVNRRSPSRYISLQNLFILTPNGSNGFSEFLKELENDPPVLIISSKTSQQGLPYLGLSENDICSECSAEIKTGVITFKRYVDHNYQPYTDIENWAVFKRIE